MRGRKTSFYVSFVLVCAVALGASVAAQTRTTPVTVENTPTVHLDPDYNRVQAEQSGPWSVSILNVPTVRFDPAANTVKAEQSGTWTVGISSSANTVKTPTSSAMYQCWTTDQVVPDGGSVTWYSSDMTGYKEARVMLFANSAHPDLKVSVAFVGPVSTNSIGWCKFHPGSVGIITQADFSPMNYQSAFTVPLMSNRMSLSVQNNTGASVTVSRGSWVYVVN